MISNGFIGAKSQIISSQGTFRKNYKISAFEYEVVNTEMWATRTWNKQRSIEIRVGRKTFHCLTDNYTESYKPIIL